MEENPLCQPEILTQGVKYDGFPHQLGFFLFHVLSYMELYGQDIPSDNKWMRIVTMALEGAAAQWMVTLHNANAPKLHNINHFMVALRRRF